MTASTVCSGSSSDLFLISFSDVEGAELEFSKWVSLRYDVKICSGGTVVSNPSSKSNTFRKMVSTAEHPVPSVTPAIKAHFQSLTKFR